MAQSYASAKITFEGSPTCNGKEKENVFSFNSTSLDLEKEASAFRLPSLRMRNNLKHLQESDNFWCDKLPLSPTNLLHKAATKLQKVYRSFRTRRQLADCAVLVEQRWWQLLDIVELKRSSISFFDIEKPETAVSRWYRARTKAAKVGKGLSKDEKARKLALQHWLEAIDPRHRYGHNLQFYYVKWLHCDSKQPFFYWLDIGEGKEINIDRCFRSKLQQQCIKYLGPIERRAYEVVVDKGMLFYKEGGAVLDTRGGPKDAKWIFVLSTSKAFYVGQKNKGKFQHSSFLAGGATLSAGRLEAEDGVLKAVWPHSGHYLPTEDNFQTLMSFLKERDVDLNNVKCCPIDDEVANFSRTGKVTPHNASNASLTQLNEEMHEMKPTQVDNIDQETCNNATASKYSSNPLQKTTWSRRIGSHINRLEIPQKPNAVEIFGEGAIAGKPCSTQLVDPSPSEDGYETAEESFLTEEDFMVPKTNLFDEELEERCSIPREKIWQRIDAHRVLRSYQLAQHLSTKWTTGAGPRIGCMRDYPMELQSHVLEQTNLSPRGETPHHHHAYRSTLSRLGPKVLSPTPLCRSPTAMGRSRLAQEQVSLSQPVTP